MPPEYAIYPVLSHQHIGATGWEILCWLDPEGVNPMWTLPPMCKGPCSTASGVLLWICIFWRKVLLMIVSTALHCLLVNCDKWRPYQSLGTSHSPPLYELQHHRYTHHCFCFAWHQWPHWGGTGQNTGLYGHVIWCFFAWPISWQHFPFTGIRHQCLVCQAQLP